MREILVEVPNNPKNLIEKGIINKNTRLELFIPEKVAVKYMMISENNFGSFISNWITISNGKLRLEKLTGYEFSEVSP